MESSVTVFLRDQFNLSSIELTIGSNIATAEVIPANSIAKNSNGASICPIMPIILKIIGKTTNIRPVPSLTNWTIGVPVENDMNPKIENIPKAVKTSNEEFAKTTSNTLSFILEPSGK